MASDKEMGLIRRTLKQLEELPLPARNRVVNYIVSQVEEMNAVGFKPTVDTRRTPLFTDDAK